MNKIQIYNPFTDKIVNINKYKATAKKIYKYYIETLGNTPDEILPRSISYSNGKFKRIKTIIDNSNVRRITYTETNGNTSYAYNLIKEFYKGSTIKLIKRYINPQDYALDIGEEYIGEQIQQEQTFDLSKKGEFTSIYLFLQIDSDTTLFSPVISQDLSPSKQAQLLIMTLDKVKSKKINQYFLDGISHCVLNPILEWATDKKDNSNSKSSERNYNSIINKVNKYTSIYKDGIPEEDFDEIVNNLSISIDIDLPSTIGNSIKFLSFESMKKPIKKFRYINTRLNHVELNEVVNTNNYIEVSQEKINEIYNDNKDNFLIYKKSGDTILQVNTLQGVYKSGNSEYMEAIKELDLKGVRIEYNSNKDLSEYLIDNLNHNYHKSFLDDNNELDTGIDNDNNDLNHIDIKKAYATCDECDLYEGYLGKITDFRQCNKIMGIGIYTINNIKCDVEIINKIGMLHNNKAYPSVELKFFKTLGITFDIIAGCWGEKIDFKIPPSMYKKDKDNVKHYCRWYGCLMRLSDKNRFNFTCKNIELAELNAYNNKDCVIRYNYNNKEGIIEYPKKHYYHSSQIAIFIHSYTRITMIQQLLKFKDINQIKALVVDGIYYNGDVDILDRFSDKEKKDLKYINNDSDYVDNNQLTFNSRIYQYIHEFKKNNDKTELIKKYKLFVKSKDYYNYPKFRNNNKIEIHLGAGGSGKTYCNLMDDGYINKLYVAPSWKLAKEKESEFNINSTVFKRLISEDPTVWKIIYDYYNVLIIDEISMMSEEEKQIIIKRFDKHKIIFCGDIGYQLGAITGTEFKLDKYPIINHTKNYRCKCEKLDLILSRLRRLLENQNYYINIKSIGLNIINFKDINYNQKDLIITTTNTRKDLFTKHYKNIEKYSILANYKNYSNTQIVYTKPQKGIKHELRHGFTIYSVQGMTAKNKLFIDCKGLFDTRTIYTAISRAETLDQIVLFK